MTDLASPEHSDGAGAALNSRRAMLVGAVGALGAWAAGALGKPQVARAGVDGDVVLGADNVSAQPTTIHATAQPLSAHASFLEPHPSIPSEHIAVHGYVETETDGIGVQGTGGAFGAGVKGTTQDGAALLGIATFDGFALKTFGRVRLTGHSGIALIAAGRNSVTVQLAHPRGVYPTPHVTVSPMVNLAGRSLWYTADSKADTLTFHISSPRSSTTRLTWIMLD